MTYILATKDKNGMYRPEEIIGDLNDYLSGVEYGDAKEGEIQLWEYPSGKIFIVQPDRNIEGTDYYATPYRNGEMVWRPELILAKENKEMVIEAFEKLN